MNTNKLLGHQFVARWQVPIFLWIESYLKDLKILFSFLSTLFAFVHLTFHSIHHLIFLIKFNLFGQYLGTPITALKPGLSLMVLNVFGSNIEGDFCLNLNWVGFTSILKTSKPAFAIMFRASPFVRPLLRLTIID